MGRAIRSIQQPATLLTESLSQPSGDNGCSLGVKLADLMAPVVVLGVGQIGIATLGLTPGRVRGTGFARSGPAVEPVHKIILGRRKISPPTQIQPNPGVKINRSRNFFALRDHKVTASPASSGGGYGKGVE